MRLRLFLLGLLASLLGTPVPAGDLEAIPPSSSDGSASGPGDSDAEPAPAAQPPLGSLAERPRSSARLAAALRIAESARSADGSAHVLSAWDELALSAYAEEVSQSLRDQAGGSIAQVLSSLPSTERTWMVVRWAFSPREKLRLALALAAAHPLHAIGLYSALDRLAGDPDPEIREAAGLALQLKNPDGRAASPRRA